MAPGRQVLPAAAALIAAAAACTRLNPIFCDELGECEPGWECDVDRRECIFHGRDAGWDGEGCADSTRCPDPMPICDAEHVCQACSPGAGGDADCAARSDLDPDDPPLPICRDDGRCVACLDDDGCSEPTADFCDQATGQCRGCLAHDECTSEVCNIGQGSCADPSGILYVDNVEGADGAGCGDQGSPCASLTAADGALIKVGPGRRTVRLRGGQGYAETLDLDAIAVVIVGPGAVLQPVTPNVAAIAARNGASVTIDGLQVSGADGASAGDGVRCSDTGTVMRIERALIADNADIGVEVEAGCDLRMSRTVVARNLGGGVRILSDSFEVTHSILAGNGDGTSALGGLGISQTGTTGTRRIEFATIAGNTTSAGAAGMQCQGAGLAAASVIVWGNTGGAELGGGCTVTYSDIEGGAPGEGNLDADPLFASPIDWHITSGSPCIDAADPAATETVDVDGEVRPQGVRRDIGADEAG